MTPEDYAQAAERIARVLRSLPPDATIIGVAVDMTCLPSIHVLNVPEGPLVGAMLDADHFGDVVEGVRVFRCATAREKAAWVLGAGRVPGVALVNPDNYLDAPEDEADGDPSAPRFGGRGRAVSVVEEGE